MSKQTKYPPYPDSNWDYAVKESARMALNKPNKFICLYCHQQAILEYKIEHKSDCPNKVLVVIQDGNEFYDDSKGIMIFQSKASKNDFDTEGATQARIEFRGWMSRDYPKQEYRFGGPYRKDNFAKVNPEKYLEDLKDGV